MSEQDFTAVDTGRYTDESFSRDYVAESTLLIQLYPEQILYAVWDGRYNWINLIGSHPVPSNSEASEMSENIIDVLRSDSTFFLPYKKILVSWGGNSITLVPQLIHDPARKGATLSLLTGDPNSEADLFDQIDEYGVTLEYRINKQIAAYLYENFEDVQVCHSDTALIKGIYQTYGNEEEERILLHVHGHTLKVCRLREGTIQYFNTFAFESAKDFVYFSLLAFERFNIDRQRCPLTISGAIMEDSMNYSLLHRYVRNIEFTPNLEDINIAPGLSDLPGHLYFNLFAHKLCE